MAGGRDMLMDLVVPLLFPHGGDATAAPSSGSTAAAAAGGDAGGDKQLQQQHRRAAAGKGDRASECGGGGGGEGEALLLVGPASRPAQQWRRAPQQYPALCPTVLCNLASMVCPF